MNGLLLMPDSTIKIFFLQPGAIMFGLLLILFSVSITLIFFIEKNKTAARILQGILFLILIILGGILAFDLSGGVGRIYTQSSVADLSVLFSTHRWLLMQLPILLSSTSLIIISTYHQDLHECHARPYLRAIQWSMIISFAVILLIGFESLV